MTKYLPTLADELHNNPVVIEDTYTEQDFNHDKDDRYVSKQFFNSDSDSFF